MSGEFEKKVLQIVKKIKKGKLSTYQLVAQAVGHPLAWRAVGNALNKNPHAPTIPCHRVIKSNGEIGGYAQGSHQKKKILRQEGIPCQKNRVLNFRKYLVKLK